MTDEALQEARLLLDSSQGAPNGSRDAEELRDALVDLGAKYDVDRRRLLRKLEQFLLNHAQAAVNSPARDYDAAPLTVELLRAFERRVLQRRSSEGNRQPPTARTSHSGRGDAPRARGPPLSGFGFDPSLDMWLNWAPSELVGEKDETGLLGSPERSPSTHNSAATEARLDGSGARKRVRAELCLPGDDDADETYAARKKKGCTDAVLGDTGTFDDLAAGSAVAVGGVSVVVDSAEAISGRYMFELPGDCVMALRARLQSIASRILARNGLELSACGLRTKSQDDVVVIGRMHVGDAAAASAAPSILLEDEEGDMVALDLSALPEYFVFPGQIVAVRGTNPDGNRIVVRELYDDASDVRPNRPRTTTAAPSGFAPAAGARLRIAVAAGPFTTSLNLRYEPLADFLRLVEEMRPDVIVLLGPFLDERHRRIADVQDVVLASVLEHRVLERLRAARERLPCTTIVLAPSCHDIVHSVCALPQPPLEGALPAGLISTPNPFVLSVTSSDAPPLRVAGVASTALEDLNAASLAKGVSGFERLMRTAEQPLRQQSFYPLYPPSPSTPLRVSAVNHLELRGVELFIIPSKLKPFVVWEHDACIVNPGTLTKGVAGGTFALLERESTSNGERWRGVVRRI
ncbi:hypothetical protein CDCA_CDCA06G1964 [Cyanidium caldarium]|uniref:DNA polymerase alpha subunit B n=1 Tax=Cyanidium caldarium TaxID=2771 RepID=A0AAV9IUW7_CYACA|nr:hypothetical protein CDCA_CDCA06G1964 [Cyanidium caldarium]